MTMIRPQLAAKTDNLLASLARGFVLEPKLDGFRAILQKKGESVRILSRTGSDVTAHLPHLVDEVRKYPDDCVLDGELVFIDSFESVAGQSVPRVIFRKTAEVMQSNPYRAVQLQQHKGLLTFVVFDCLGVKHFELMDFPDHYRRSAVMLICGYLSEVCDGALHIVPIPRFEQWDRELVERFIELGFEGVILKDPKATYAPGKRSKTWLKYKSVETADVVCLGFNPGNGSWKNLVGSIRFGQYKDGKLVERGQCSGFPMSLRYELTKNGASYIGKPFSIKYMGHSGKGRNGMRHPQFAGWREPSDKAAEDCVWDS